MEYFAFQWHITEACDQRCKHCYIYALGATPSSRRWPWRTWSGSSKTARPSAAKAGRLPYFYLTGGDPILHPQFWRLAGLLKEQDLPFAILGNPFHLTDDVCQKLRDHGCRKYQLSLDGLRETHDRIRRPGSYDETLAAIPLFAAGGHPRGPDGHRVQVERPGDPALVDVAVEHQADIFAFARYCPSQADRDTTCSPLEYRALLEACWEKFQAYEAARCPTTFSRKDHLWTLLLYEKGLFPIDETLDPDTIYDGCNCGNCHMTILSDGAVYACRRMESKVGNALTDDLYDLFTGLAYEAYRQYDQFEKVRQV